LDPKRLILLANKKENMKLKPLGDRIVVKPVTQEEVTKSGIVLPDTVEKEKKEEGEIVAIGDGEKIKKFNLQIGQKVIFGKYAGDEVKLEDVEYKVLKDEDVLAVIE
jgi:chaperonin GroES